MQQNQKLFENLKNTVNLVTIVNRESYFVSKFYQLCITRKSLSEAMLRWAKKIVFLEVGNKLVEMMCSSDLHMTLVREIGL